MTRALPRELRGSIPRPFRTTLGGGMRGSPTGPRVGPSAIKGGQGLVVAGKAMMEFRFGQDGSDKDGQARRPRRSRKPHVEGLEDRRLLSSGLMNEYPVPTASTSPVSIAKGSDGNLWYVERDSSTIGQITPSGTVATFTIPTGAMYIAAPQLTMLPTPASRGSA